MVVQWKSSFQKLLEFARFNLVPNFLSRTSNVLIAMRCLRFYFQTMSIEPIECRINWTQSNDCDSIVERNRKSIEYYLGFAVRLSNVIESIEYYGKFQFNWFDYVWLGNTIRLRSSCSAYLKTLQFIRSTFKRLGFRTNSNWLINNYLGIQLSQSKRQSIEPIERNRTQSNAIERLKFDCRMQSNFNRTSKF